MTSRYATKAASNRARALRRTLERLEAERTRAGDQLRRAHADGLPDARLKVLAAAAADVDRRIAARTAELELIRAGR